MLTKEKKVPFAFPSHQKNLDRLTLFLHREDVMAVIQQAREVLELPPEGLSDTQQIIDWNASLYARSEQIAESQEFLQRRALIKQGIEKKEIDMVMANRHLEVLYADLPENYLTLTVDYIITLCDLPANYGDSVRTYIVSNTLHAPPEVFTEGPYVYAEKVDRSKFVTMTFYAKLTDADLKELKRYVNEIAGRRLPEFQPIAGIKKMMKIEEMLRDPERPDENSGNMRRMPASEIAAYVEEELGVKTTRGDVYENKRALKKLREIRPKVWETPHN